MQEQKRQVERVSRPIGHSRTNRNTCYKQYNNREDVLYLAICQWYKYIKEVLLVQQKYQWNKVLQWLDLVQHQHVGQH